jgi:hypothetical protein
MSDDVKMIVKRGLGVTLTGPLDPKSLVLPITALVPFAVRQDRTGFAFQDTVATVETEYDVNFPDGYGTVFNDKYGDRHKRYSNTTALIGGGYRITIYLAQFGLPCEPGQHVIFYAGPAEFVDACLEAIKQELFPPEYTI